MTSPLCAEDNAEKALRPSSLEQFIGQAQIRRNLHIFIEAALKRKEALDHVLLFGPPGLGKTTLAQIIARELGVHLQVTAGPLIAKSGDLAALLTKLEAHDVLFIDEIHRLTPAVEEILYPAMEDYHLDLMVGEGPAARSVRLTLPPFTLIGATTRSGLLSAPLRDRFGIPLRLNFYTPPELAKILQQAAQMLGFSLDQAGFEEVSRRARGTPRIALRLLRRIRDFALIHNKSVGDLPLVQKALTELQIDCLGLDAADRRYLEHIAHHFAGGPVGIETLSAALSEEKDTLEEVIEPYLIQSGLIQRTPRGRCLSPTVYHHLGLPVPEKAAGP